MEAAIDEAGGQIHQAGPLDSVGADEYDIVGAQQVDKFFRAEAVVANFHGVAQRHSCAGAHVDAVGEPFVVAARDGGGFLGVEGQKFQEGFDTLGVETKIRRELPKDRAELGAETENARGQEICEGRLNVFESFHVGDEARAFYGENKIVGGGGGPGLEILGALERIEGAVDFYGAKNAGGVFEFALLW